MSVLISNLNTIESIKLDIRSAIEEKGVDMTGLSFPDYPAAISQISTGGTFVTETLSVSSNGTYTPSAGIDGFSQVIVDVPQSATGYTLSDVIMNNNVYGNLYDSTVTYVPTGGLIGGLFIGDANVTYWQANGSLLSSVDLPACSNVNTYGFYSQSKLTTVYLSSCSYVYDSAFELCSNLTFISLPVCTYIKKYAFRSCYALPSISLPECSNIGPYAFTNCSSLSQVTLYKCELIGLGVFSGCKSLEALTINSTSVCTLSNSNAFTGTKIASGTGSIYVPSSLVATYKASKHWSTYASQIFPIQEPSLAFDSTTGLLYGTASSIYWEFESSLGISLTDILAVSLSQCTSVGAAAFRGCTNLSTVTLDSCDYIGDGAFTSTGLQTLHLGGSNVCQVDSWGPNIDNNTFVSLYVPSSLVTSYETASYWSNFSSKIVPIQ